MIDCTGYGFGNQITLCLKGAVGKGNTSDLEIRISRKISDYAPNNFTSNAVVTVPDWDGNGVVVDLTSVLNYYGGYNDAGCTVNARLIITPESGTTGTMLLEFRLSDCTDSGYPNAFVECGGAGPHIISEMSTFDLSDPACAI